jgi:DNA-binding transcriptional regulator YhcF (GntR family)
MMDEIKTVDDLLKAKKVTYEERELLQDIIETARTNERKIREYAEQMRSNFNRLSKALQNMEERTVILNKALQGLLDATDTLHLRLMPSEKFYRE